MNTNRMAMLLLICSSVCFSTLGNNAFAQEPAKADESAKSAPLQTLPPAYQPQMLRLSEVLGSLHYLRALCGANEGQKWREEMQAMIEAEEPTADRKSQLIAHFNRGFRSFREIYRECTPAASQAAGEYLRQGVKLSAEIPSRYGS